MGVVSLGCAKNLVDTEVMLGHLGRAGAAFVRDPSEADVIVVNTCAFIEEAREESIRAILEAAEHKKTGRARRLVVAGCLVQRYPRELRESLPEVDAWIGLDDLPAAVAAAGLGTAPTTTGRGRLASEAERAPRRAAHAATRRAKAGTSVFLYDHTTPRRIATPPWTAYVKISEGCDHACSFCAIPAIRGRFRSRSAESVVREVTALARSGALEINLIAQDSSGFGRDLGLERGLAELVERLDGVEGPRWFRVLYLYPSTVSDELIETIARLPRVVKYVDLPLQHAHPAVLRRMRRGGSAESHRALLDRVRGAIPGVAVRSTLIVGFPGETEEEFETLLDFVAEARFEHLGVFTYSHEEGTAAFALGDDVPRAEKEERRRRVMELQQRVVHEHNARWVGRTVEVLVEGAHPETEHLLVGRMPTQAPEVDGQVLLCDGAADPGSLVRVEITEVAGYDLAGRILREI